MHLVHVITYYSFSLIANPRSMQERNRRGPKGLSSLPAVSEGVGHHGPPHWSCHVIASDITQRVCIVCCLDDQRQTHQYLARSCLYPTVSVLTASWLRQVIIPGLSSWHWLRMLSVCVGSRQILPKVVKRKSFYKDLYAAQNCKNLTS